ncbi:hypothetical protein CORC01_06585 [Colletotrichum orchidophilum]|uniref:HeH/LEM domain-containing protein n=1 Tax=Colletotrichum orchidophilum TaxID=1209926 RepID=A0A1G4B9K5_9PEZI|nr:uncharacterized protein CORC01_06585 [Colletotrichum orchidophilum]OHE98071.1 hypothetical protein CORC01_06585 [Colletotrichum orchidophilum]
MDSTQSSNRKQAISKPMTDKTWSEIDIVETNPRLEENNNAATATKVLPRTRVVKHTQTSLESASRTRTKKFKRENESLGTSRSVPSRKLVITPPLETIPSLNNNVDSLQPEFNANSITVKELIEIFVAYKIKFYHNSKKESLIALFEKEVEPRASATLRERAKIKRSAEGIVNVRSYEPVYQETNLIMH